MKKKVFLHINPALKEKDDVVNDICNFLTNQNCEIITDIKSDCKKIDFAISLGGDGTFLAAAEILIETQIPIYGINLGHVGFLSDGDIKNYFHDLELLVNGKYKIKSRAILEVTIENTDGSTTKEWAINDIAIEKAGNAGERFGMLNTRVEVDNQAISRYGCDGIIVATSLGSTAHAYSAGGPVISPDVDAMVVVPVAAHALFSRPLILNSSSQVKFYIDETAAGFATIIADGRRAAKLETGSKVYVSKSAKMINFISFDELSSSNAWVKKLVSKFKLPIDGWR